MGKEMNLNLNLICYIKLNWKWITDLNIKYKTLHFYEKKKKERKYFKPELGEELVELTPKEKRKNG